MTADNVLLTTAVGSFGKPDYLQKARNANARGKVSATELRDLERKATAEWIKAQEEVGLDILVDGEMYRGDMVAFFADLLDGYSEGGLVRSYGNRYYHKPVISGVLKRPKPMTVEWFQYAQSLTEKPVKGMLTGPYTMLDWSYNEAYATRRDAALALAEVVRQEAEDLDRAGARYIQIDEPAIHARRLLGGHGLLRELRAHDPRRLDDDPALRDGLVDRSRLEPAVGVREEPVGAHVPQPLADPLGGFVDRLELVGVDVDDPDGHLLREWIAVHEVEPAVFVVRHREIELIDR